MKFYRAVLIYEAGFPADLYEDVTRLRPECRRTDHFYLECQPGDDALGLIAEQIGRMCKERGLRQTSDGKNGTYNYSVVRHYEPPDLLAAPFLKLETQKSLLRDRDSIGRDSLGRLLLPATQMKPGIKVASIFLTRFYVVSNAVRTVLVEGNFEGLHLIETAIQGKSVHAASEPFWELNSKLTLPKMLNSVRNEHSRHLFYMISEPPYRYGEPCYRSSELCAFGVFDVARTFEPLAGGQGLIVSQRFYQHCLKHKIPLVVEPVRIDTD